MKVELINYTPDPQRSIAVAARICYSHIGSTDLAQSMTEDQVVSVLNTIMSSGHYSALEHASFTFAIEGVSRALTHQLVRHRLASFNQQSQRYVELGEKDSMIKPESIEENEEASEIYNQAIKTIKDAYYRLVELGIPKEDSRYLLPNATESKIVVTMNARELLHFFNLRCCNRAQWEIRELATRMLRLVKLSAPLIFKNAGAPCVNGPCPEGKMSCRKKG